MFCEPARIHQKFRGVVVRSHLSPPAVRLGWIHFVTHEFSSTSANSFRRRDSNRLANRAKSIACEQAYETALDFARQPWPAINHAGVKFDQARTGADMAI